MHGDSESSFKTVEEVRRPSDYLSEVDEPKLEREMHKAEEVGFERQRRDVHHRSD